MAPRRRVPATGIGQLLRTRREARGMSLSLVARRARLTKAYLSQLESGARTNPTRPTLRALARVLAMPVDEISEALDREQTATVLADLGKRKKSKPLQPKEGSVATTIVQDATCSGADPITETGDFANQINRVSIVIGGVAEVLDRVQDELEHHRDPEESYAAFNVRQGILTALIDQLRAQAALLDGHAETVRQIAARMAV